MSALQTCKVRWNPTRLRKTSSRPSYFLYRSIASSSSRSSNGNEPTSSSTPPKDKSRHIFSDALAYPAPKLWSDGFEKYPDFNNMDAALDRAIIPPEEETYAAKMAKRKFVNPYTGVAAPKLTTRSPHLSIYDYTGAFSLSEQERKEADEMSKQSVSVKVSLKDALRKLGPNPHIYWLVSKRVVNQTSKGRRNSLVKGYVIGNGNGIVGYGEAKAEEPASEIAEKAQKEAVKNCCSVELFENRTIWSEREIKFGSTKIVMRPRPRGFGLACNPNVHQVCKAAGIKDISAKVYGSRNKMNVIKATIMLLHSGGTPPAMGDGIGGKARREESKSGLRTREAVERERGRAFVEGGSWI